MKLIKADHHRRLEITGVPNPVQRPVDIDRSQTGFRKLRSLRIYHFDAGSVINGHAEEDEVLIVVMGGTVELTLIDNNSGDSGHPFTVSAASDSPGQPCAAYLPPDTAYRLIPRTGADVAYARATPAGGPPPRIFSSHASPAHEVIALLLEEASYPRLLRVRLLQVRPEEHEIAIDPMEEIEEPYEALLHFRTVPEERVATIAEIGAVTVPLTSWDTVAVTSGDHPTLRIAAGSSALVLIVTV
jgi:KduI/IolB family